MEGSQPDRDRKKGSGLGQKKEPNKILRTVIRSVTALMNHQSCHSE